MDLSAALWGQLPFEVLEQVLSFVPVPDLCRYRSVSKRWNRLISNREFGALCVRNAKRLSSFMIFHYTCNMSRRADEPRSERQQFCFLDLSARRWYKHSDAAHEISLCDKRFSQIMAMDGGLVVCQYWATKSDRPSALVVYNPIANTKKELPSLPDHWSSVSKGRPLLNLVVDNVTQTFKIFFMSHSVEMGKLEDPETTLEERMKILNNPVLRFYNSATSEWKGLTNLSCIVEAVGPRIGFEIQVYPVSTVMFQDFPHVLLRSDSYDVTNDFFGSCKSKHQLLRYNLQEDSWENMHCKLLHSGDLIVSANRLFLVGWSLVDWRTYHPGKSERRFEVSEINIPDMTCEPLFTWTKAQVMDVFDIKKAKDSLQIHVTGFDSSLMFMCSATPGKLVSFDFVTRKWDREWPPNPLLHLPYGQYCSWVGKQMNLLLPGTLW